MTSTLLPERVVLRKKKKRARQEIVPSGILFILYIMEYKFKKSAAESQYGN